MGISLTDRKEAAADWKVTPTAGISISAKYDDNVTSEKSKIYDLVTIPLPRVGLTLERDVTKIQTGATVKGEVYSRDSSLNFNSYGGFVNMTTNINPINSLRLSERASYAPETQEVVDTVQTEEGDIETLITVKRGARISNRGSVSWSHQFSELTSGAVGYSNSFTFFKDPTQIDTTTHSGNIRLSRRLDRSTSVSGSYQFSYYVIKGSENSQNNNLSVGLSRTLSPSWSFRGHLGVNYTLQPGRQNTAFLGGGAGLSKKITDQFGTSLSYSANISPSGGVSGDIVRNQSLSLRANQIISRSMSGSVNVRVGDSHSLVTNDVNIFSWSAGAGLSYRLTQSISMGAHYTHSQQISRGATGSDFSRNQYAVSLSAELL